MTKGKSQRAVSTGLVANVGRWLPSPLPSPQVNPSGNPVPDGRGGSLRGPHRITTKRSPSPTEDIANTNRSPWERAGVRAITAHLKLTLCLLAVLLPACQKVPSATNSSTNPVAVRTTTVTTDSIPLSAIVEGDGLKAKIFSVSNSKAHRLDITLKQITPTSAQLTTALPANTALVTTGAEFLTDGAQVIITHDPER